MVSNRRRDTGPELALRRALFARGMRFRVDHSIRLEGGRPIRPDIVCTRPRVAVFVDGCFWHGCPEHGSMPKSNRDFWVSKIKRNRERDRAQTAVLEAAGWKVVRVWEHDPIVSSTDHIADVVERRRSLPEFGEP